MQKKSLMLFTVALGLTLFLGPMQSVRASIAMPNNASWMWGVDVDDQLVYHVVDNVIGERYLGFEVDGASVYGGGNIMNLSLQEYAYPSGPIQDSGVVFFVITEASQIWAFSDNSSVFQTFMYAFPLIPLTSSGGALDLYIWGGILTSPAHPMNTYGSQFNLTEYAVVGNVLQMYNSTTGHYCNITYDTNGIMQSAEIYLATDFGSGIFRQSITKDTDISKINMLQYTDFQYPANNLLIYQALDKEDNVQDVFAYDIYKDEISINPPFNVPMHIIQGNQKTWNPVNLNWDLKIDGEHGTIGAANDFQNYHGGTGPTNYLFSVGTTATDVNETYWAIYVDPLSTNSVFDTVEILSTYELKYSILATGDYMYWKLSSNGTLMEYIVDTPVLNGQYVKYMYITVEDIDMTDYTDEIAVFPQVNDEYFYHFTNKTSMDLYGKYQVTFSGKAGYTDNIHPYSAALTVDCQYKEWIGFNWVATVDPFGMEDDITLSAQNENYVMFAEWGPNNLFFHTMVTGQFINDSWGETFRGFVNFDTFIFNSNSWNASNSVIDEWFNVTFDSNGLVSVLDMNFTAMGDYFNYRVVRIAANDVPQNTIPQITAPADITYEAFTTGHTIEWTITDPNVGVTNYVIYRNGAIVTTGVWMSGFKALIDIDGLAVGSYNYTIIATDGLGGTGRDEVIVTVTPQPNVDPSISSPSDISYVAGATGNSISWTVTDLTTTTTNYKIYRNGTQMTSASWISGIAIVYGVDGLNVGSYNITIIATDGRGGEVSDTVIVTVTAPETSTTTTTSSTTSSTTTSSETTSTTTSATSSSTTTTGSSTTSSENPPQFGGIPGYPIGILALMICIGLFIVRKRRFL
jgi:hypothetical protein